MRTNNYYTTRLITLFLTLVFSANTAYSQLLVTGGLDIDSLVYQLAGPGVSIYNVSTDCHVDAAAYFESVNGDVGGIDNGLLIATGNATNAMGPNVSPFITTRLNYHGDSDLSKIVDTITFDACVIEFDVVPEFDSLNIFYSVSSDEYPQWVNQSYKDAFGIFVTGPGIPNKTVNIAQVPATNTPVTIKNMFGPSNVENFTNNMGGSTVEYDAISNKVGAGLKVYPNKAYHVKIVLADAADDWVDTGVFIEKGGIRGNVNNTFPVELLHFDAAVKNGNAEIAWTSAQELNNEEYIIERSIDGRAFEKVGEVGGAGTSNAPINYSYTDKNVVQYNLPTVYYRLKQIDYNGTAAYIGNIIELQVPVQQLIVDAFPNPATDFLTLRLGAADRTDFDVRIVNAMGHIVEARTFPEVIGEYSTTIDVSNLPRGIYYIESSSENSSSTIKVNVQ